ncbi:MAG: ADP-ribosylglycohydrolase family protein [Candidatus Promineifilaceae bacterium]|nr:ADP-ribosylglycohydrolase family protein [Candidatus Promineifilaceae bacterium]
MAPSSNEHRLGCLLGLACGDAVGTTVEFRSRGSFEPLTDMVGGGPFGLAPGQWTDDTSMALCLAESLVESDGFDPADQMERYVRWWRHGHLSSTGSCFDIGNTTAAALRRFERTGEPYSGSTDPYTAGNGSIMRLAPISIYFSPDLEAVIHYSGESSRTTHGAAECVDACRYFGSLLHLALIGEDKEGILTADAYSPQTPKIAAIARGDYQRKSCSAIRGSGYVVESLEAALWCFWRTDSYEAAILEAANLGDDADTTAAVCGQISGAYYGVGGMPEGWLAKVALRETIITLVERLGDRPR